MKNKKIGRQKIEKKGLLEPSFPRVGRFNEGNDFFSSICWFARLYLWGRDFAVDFLTGIFQRFLATFCHVPVKQSLR